MLWLGVLPHSMSSINSSFSSGNKSRRNACTPKAMKSRKSRNIHLILGRFKCIYMPQIVTQARLISRLLFVLSATFSSTSPVSSAYPLFTSRQCGIMRAAMAVCIVLDTKRLCYRQCEVEDSVG